MSVRNARRPSRPASLRLFAAVTPQLRVLVLTMLVFNAGFYLVLPFLAAHLTGSVGLAGGVVGTLLGLRMLSQQGLFVVGGVVSDRLGARRAVLAGVALRVVSFGLLGWVTDVRALLAAVILLGVAGALFTPAVEALVADEAEGLARAGGPSRTEVFALYSAFGQVGTVAGPALGALLLLGGFRWSCLAAAAVFATAYVVLSRALPRDLPSPDRARPEWGLLLGNRRFLAFAAGFSGYLAVYNQLYLAVPLELTRSGHPAALAGWLFTASAVVVVLLQVQVSARVSRHLGAGHSVPLGFVLLAAGAAAPALLGPGGALPALALFVGLLTFGQMLLLPASRDAVARLAGERMLGTHYGVVGTASGIAVLVVSAAVGWAFDLAARGDAPGSSPWLLMSAVAVVSAAVTGRALGPPHQGGPTREHLSTNPGSTRPDEKKGQPCAAE